jgi:hypothetical protein
VSAGEIAQRMRGRSPDDDALAFARHWDALTRRTVLERAANVPEVRFFTDEEAATLRAFCDVVTGQDSEPRIPVLEMIDERLVDAGPDGFRHHDMPPAPETWRRIAANLDASARDAGCEGGFAAADGELRDELVERFAKGELDWDLPVGKAWAVVMRGVLAAFYSHPWAGTRSATAGLPTRAAWSRRADIRSRAF